MGVCIWDLGKSRVSSAPHRLEVPFGALSGEGPSLAMPPPPLALAPQKGGRRKDAPGHGEEERDRRHSRGLGGKVGRFKAVAQDVQQVAPGLLDPREPGACFQGNRLASRSYPSKPKAGKPISERSEGGWEKKEVRTPPSAGLERYSTAGRVFALPSANPGSISSIHMSTTRSDS